MLVYSLFEAIIPYVLFYLFYNFMNAIIYIMPQPIFYKHHVTEKQC